MKQKDNSAGSLQQVELPKEAKYVAGGVLGIAAFLVVRKYVKKAKESAEAASVNSAIQQSIVVNRNNTTISEAQATIIANKLYGAMEGLGTDEKQIIDCLSGLNADDIKMVYKAFGLREYNTFGSPLFSWLPSTYLDLTGWFRKELSGSTLKKVQTMFSNTGIRL